MKAHKNLFITCFELCRVSNLPTIWTNVLAAQVIAGGSFKLPDFLLLALVLSAFYLAGMTLNDLCDFKVDQEKRPGRPIPSGRISLQGARLLVILLFSCGFLLLGIFFSPKAFGAAMLLTAAIILYDMHHKNNPLSVIVMALCRFLLFAVTSFAIADRLAPLAMIAGAVQFAYVLVISVVARLENRRTSPFAIPVIPLMLAGISLLDGVVLAVLAGPFWLTAGICGMLLTAQGQKYFRGD